MALRGKSCATRIQPARSPRCPARLLRVAPSSREGRREAQRALCALGARRAGLAPRARPGHDGRIVLCSMARSLSLYKRLELAQSSSTWQIAALACNFPPDPLVRATSHGDDDGHESLRRGGRVLVAA